MATNVTFNIEHYLMTIDTLNTIAALHQSNPKSATKGVVMPPQLKIEPSMYITPLLHLMIGLEDKVWFSLSLFIDKFIESIGKEEAKLEDECEKYCNKIEDIDEKPISTWKYTEVFIGSFLQTC